MARPKEKTGLAGVTVQQRVEKSAAFENRAKQEVDKLRIKVAKSLEEDLLRLFEDGDHSDVALLTEGNEIKAHRCIIEARSRHLWQDYWIVVETDALGNKQQKFKLTGLSDKQTSDFMRQLYVVSDSGLLVEEFLSFLPGFKECCDNVSVSNQGNGDVPMCNNSASNEMPLEDIEGDESNQDNASKERLNEKSYISADILQTNVLKPDGCDVCELKVDINCSFLEQETCNGFEKDGCDNHNDSSELYKNSRKCNENVCHEKIVGTSESISYSQPKNDNFISDSNLSSIKDDSQVEYGNGEPLGQNTFNFVDNNVECSSVVCVHERDEIRVCLNNGHDENVLTAEKENAATAGNEIDLSAENRVEKGDEFCLNDIMSCSLHCGEQQGSEILVGGLEGKDGLNDVRCENAVSSTISHQENEICNGERENSAQEGMVDFASEQDLDVTVNHQELPKILEGSNVDITAVREKDCVCVESDLSEAIKNSYALSIPYETCSALGRDLLQMFLQQKNCDICLSVDGVKFLAHKCILGARCSYFSAMLGGKWCESDMEEIDLQGVSAQAIEQLLLFLYGGVMELCTPSDLMELFIVTDMYGVETLKLVLEFYIRKDLCHFFHKPCNTCIVSASSALSLCHSFYLEELEERCLKWCGKYFTKIWSNKSFAGLPEIIHQKCAESVLSTMTEKSVLDVIIECSKLSTSLPRIKWTESILYLTTQLMDSAIEYTSSHFVDVIRAPEFLQWGKVASWKSGSLEEIFNSVIDSLPIDTACFAYQTLVELKASQSDLEFKDQDVLELLNSMVRRCEKFLRTHIHQVARSKQWASVGKSLQSKILENSSYIHFDQLPEPKPKPVRRPLPASLVRPRLSSAAKTTTTSAASAAKSSLSTSLSTSTTKTTPSSSSITSSLSRSFAEGRNRTAARGNNPLSQSPSSVTQRQPKLKTSAPSVNVSSSGFTAATASQRSSFTSVRNHLASKNTNSTASLSVLSSSAPSSFRQSSSSSLSSSRTASIRTTATSITKPRADKFKSLPSSSVTLSNKSKDVKSKPLKNINDLKNGVSSQPSSSQSSQPLAKNRIKRNPSPLSNVPTKSTRQNKMEGKKLSKGENSSAKEMINDVQKCNSDIDNLSTSTSLATGGTDNEIVGAGRSNESNYNPEITSSSSPVVGIDRGSEMLSRDYHVPIVVDDVVIDENYLSLHPQTVDKGVVLEDLKGDCEEKNGDCNKLRELVMIECGTKDSSFADDTGAVVKANTIEDYSKELIEDVAVFECCNSTNDMGVVLKCENVDGDIKESSEVVVADCGNSANDLGDTWSSVIEDGSEKSSVAVTEFRKRDGNLTDDWGATSHVSVEDDSKKSKDGVEGNEVEEGCDEAVTIDAKGGSNGLEK